MKDDMLTSLRQRIDDLECKVAFQEQTIDDLNEALSHQQLLITKMQDQMKFVVGKVKNMDTSNLADPSQETPPHITERENGCLADKAISDDGTRHHQTTANPAQLVVWLLTQLSHHLSPAIRCNQRSESFGNQHQTNCDPN